MIEQWSRGDADEHMPEEILVDLAAIIRRHPWWQARRCLTLDLLADLGLNPPAGPRRRLRLGRDPRCPGTARLPRDWDGRLAPDARGT